MVALSDTQPTVNNALGTPDGTRGQAPTHTYPRLGENRLSQQNVETPISQRPLELSRVSNHSVDPIHDWSNIESKYMGTGNRTASRNATQGRGGHSNRGGRLSRFSPFGFTRRALDNTFSSPVYVPQPTARLLDPEGMIENLHTRRQRENPTTVGSPARIRMQKKKMSPVNESEHSPQNGGLSPEIDISHMVDSFKERMEVYQVANEGLETQENRAELRKQYNSDMQSMLQMVELLKVRLKEVEQRGAANDLQSPTSFPQPSPGPPGPPGPPTPPGGGGGGPPPGPPTPPTTPPKPKKKGKKGRTAKDLKEGRPDYTRISNIIKQIKEKGLVIEDRQQWSDLKKHLLVLQTSEMWPKYLLDLDAPKWEPTDDEDPIDARLRMEMFTVLRDSVNWKKHSAKMDKVIQQDEKMDGQMLFRTLEGYFGLGKVDDDVQSAGMSLRACSMQSTGLNVVDYGLEYQRRIKVVEALDLHVNIRREIIPMYLKGLLKVFKDTKNFIEEKLEEEPEWDPTLQDIINKVERKATRCGMSHMVYKGKEVTQNLQSENKNGKKGKAKKKENKDKEKIKQLQAKLEKYEQHAVATTGTQGGSTQNTPGQCNFGNKCWRKDCKFQHPEGFTPAPNPRDRTCEECGRKGHSRAECGRCFKCGGKSHRANECRSTVKRDQGAQEVRAEERPVMLRIK